MIFALNTSIKINRFKMASNTEHKRESEILSGPAPASITAHVIDFSDTEVNEYKGYFAMTIDNVLTKKECEDLLRLVSLSGNTWPPATVTTYDGSYKLDLESRFCDRIFYTSQSLADRLLARILPLIPPKIITLKDAPDITGQFPVIRNETWRISRLRDELRFLKYGPGQYFRPHCDGHFADKKGEQSYLTLHLYLNDAVEGGATRFAVDFEDPQAGKLDVNPKAGSLVIFQQRDMYHEGVEVTKGTKYTMRTDVMYQKV
ncbi:oxidoreductase domain-containing protein [Hypoxylon rubiginosum]|uniref:Oxidoreductase domain-containing protein n=1 Tax=Hypoxylon rubiginosum TaxID=110542 RepID=A0ACC0D3R8_9PEZI|nr:oxidoreductase domain-containing protein [Hypoxylon rubiginosum]